MRNSRADRLLAEIRELRLESRGRWDKHQARWEELSRSNRDEIRITREFLRRNEVAFNQQSGALAEQSKLLAELADEVRAGRDGLLALIDEIRGGGPSPAGS